MRPWRYIQYEIYPSSFVTKKNSTVNQKPKADKSLRYSFVSLCSAITILRKSNFVWRHVCMSSSSIIWGTSYYLLPRSRNKIIVCSNAIHTKNYGKHHNCHTTIDFLHVIFILRPNLNRVQFVKRLKKRSKRPIRKHIWFWIPVFSPPLSLSSLSSSSSLTPIFILSLPTSLQSTRPHYPINQERIISLTTEYVYKASSVCFLQTSEISFLRPRKANFYESSCNNRLQNTHAKFL